MVKPTSDSIDKMQIKLIHIALGQLGISDGEYRAILSREYDVGSSTELSYIQATTLIEQFKARGFRITGTKARGSRWSGKQATEKPRQKASNMTYMVGAPELAKIEHLRSEVNWRYEDGYQRWIVKYLGKDHISTSKEAQKVIEALKAMVKRQGYEAKTEDPF